MAAFNKQRSTAAAAFVTLLAIGAISSVAAQEGGSSAEGGAAAAPPPELVLLPPADPATACSAEVFSTVTRRFRSCAKLMFKWHDPDAECCEGLAEYYGPDSTRPSRNCFCDANVWNELTKWEADYTYYSFSTAFLVCARLGHIVPFYEENTGYCFGIPPDAETIATATVDDHSAGDIPSTQDYISRLDMDDLLMLAFVTSIMSGVGVLLLLWPMVFEVCTQAWRAVKCQEA